MKNHLQFLAFFALILTSCTPVETGSGTLTSLPTVTACPQELVLPIFIQVEPNPIAPGGEFKLIGSGGYLHDACGGVNESARGFDVYLDGQVFGQIMCYANHCEGKYVLPSETPVGTHCLSAQPEGCEIELQAAE